MSAVWYVSRSGENRGPYTSDALRQMARSGELLLTDLLWKDGMKQWRPAGESKGLFPKPETEADAETESGAETRVSSSPTKPPSVAAALFVSVLFLAALVLAGMGIRDRLKPRRLRRAQPVAAQGAPAQPQTAGPTTTPPPSQAMPAEKRIEKPPNTVTLIKATPSRKGAPLSADFLPVRDIQTHTFVETVRDPIAGEVLSSNRLTISQNGDGVISVSDSTLFPEIMTDWGPSTYRLCCEVRGDIVWYGIERYGNKETHEPLVFIGAQPGDSWMAPGGKSFYTFEGLRAENEAVVVHHKIDLTETITLKRGGGIVSRIVEGNPKRSYPLYIMRRTE